MTALWLLGAALRLRSMAGAVLAWAARNPLVAALALSLAVNVLAIHAWQVRGRAQALLTSQVAQFRTAQADASRIAAEALHHQEAVYQAKATEADHAHQTELADAHAAADRYIADHRLRAADFARGAGGAAASATGGGAGVPEGVPADAVVVSAGDVQACTGAVSYAITAHNWAVGAATP